MPQSLVEPIHQPNQSIDPQHQSNGQQHAVNGQSSNQAITINEPTPPPRTWRRTLNHDAVTSGIGLTITIAFYVFPALFLIIPQAAAGSYVNSTFYPLVMTLVAVLGAFAVIALWLTKLTDPGYLPIHTHELDSETARILDSQPNSYTMPVRPLNWQAGDAYDVEKCQAEYRTRPRDFEEFCRLCRIWRPCRAGHCSGCGRCVIGFDHHCGVIGACIGQRNHRWFVTFLTSIAFGASLVLVCSGLWAFGIPFYNRDRWSDWPPYVCLFFTMFSLYSITLCFFAGFHWLLLCNDRTTRELYGRSHASWHRTEQEREFSLFHRCWQSCSVVWCAPVKAIEDWPYVQSTNRNAVLSSKEIADYNAQLVNRSINQPHSQPQNQPDNETNGHDPVPSMSISQFVDERDVLQNSTVPSIGSGDNSSDHSNNNAMN